MPKLLINLLLIAISLIFSCNALCAEDWFEQGLSDLKSHQNEKAIEAFSKALKADPNNAEAYNNRGIAWYSIGKYDRALDDYNKALEINPRSAEILSNRGITWFSKGKYNLAINDYDKALGIDPQCAKAYTNRGATWFCKGKYELAVSDYIKALEIDPNCAETRRQLTWIQAMESTNTADKKQKGRQVMPNALPSPFAEIKEKIDRDAKIKPRKRMTPSTRSDSQETFSIQIGAFASKERAERLVAIMKGKGYAVRLRTLTDWKKKVLHTVRIGEYTDRDEAKEKAAAFTEKEKIPTTVRPTNEL